MQLLFPIFHKIINVKYNACVIFIFDFKTNRIVICIY